MPYEETVLSIDDTFLKSLAFNSSMTQLLQPTSTTPNSTAGQHRAYQKCNSFYSLSVYLYCIVSLLVMMLPYGMMLKTAQHNTGFKLQYKSRIYFGMLSKSYYQFNGIMNRESNLRCRGEKGFALFYRGFNSQLLHSDSSNALRPSLINTNAHVFCTSQRSYSSSHCAKKAKKSNARLKTDEFITKNDPNWVTVKLSSAADQKRTQMEDRLRGAAQFESMQLSDVDMQELNRKLGIEEEVMAALAAEEDDDDSFNNKNKNNSGGSGSSNGSKSSSGSSRGKQQQQRQQQVAAVRNMPSLSSEQFEEAMRVKGFLEVNPYLCSGCGTPFQSKNQEQPGFLDPKKLQQHRNNAELIREKQDAIKILEMAGIEIDSAAAQEVLRDAAVSEDVITGVRALGKLQSSNTAPAVAATTAASTSTNAAVVEDGEFIDDVDPMLLTELTFSDAVVAAETEVSNSSSGDSSVNLNADRSSSSSSNAVVDRELLEIAQMLKQRAPLSGGATAAAADSKKKKQREQKKAGRDYSYLEEQFKLLEGVDGIINDIDLDTNNVKSFTVQRGGKQSTLLNEVLSSNEVIVDAAAANDVEEGDDLETITDMRKKFVNDNICICQRCFRLQQYGQVEESLRPGWSDNELLTPERFESLLTTVKDTPAVVLCLVDIFDLRGSLLPNLRQIAGKNPVVIAANKVDLLPKDASQSRIANWIHHEAKGVCGFVSPRDAVYELQREIHEKRDDERSRRFGRRDGRYEMKRRLQEDDGVLRKQNVHLVSCQSGFGMSQLLSSVMSLAAENGNRIYVMGAANVGKSSFINRLLQDSSSVTNSLRGRNRGRKSTRTAASNVPQATVSNLPGTTLDFLKIKLPNGITMIDTPGLLSRGQLTSKLTTAELRQVIPAKPISAVTLRLEQGKCVLIGGLATIELLEGRPFFFTFFFSNEVKLHPTDATKADEFVRKHIGSLVLPPDNLDRLAAIGPFVSQVFEVSGDSWRRSNTDVVIAGLGWVSMTGTGTAKVKVTVPEGTTLDTRPALLPYEATTTAVKFTGGRLLRNTKKSRGAGQVKGYGWRA